MAIAKFIAAVVLLALLLFGGILGYGWTKAVPVVNRPVADVHIALTPERIARGRHVAEVRCVGCHSRADSVLLQGGAEFPLDTPGGILPGVLYMPNLTPGGVLKRASDGQLIRAIREGIGVDGRPLILMPSAENRELSDSDMVALIAYLRSQPASDRVPGKRSVDWYTCWLFALGKAGSSVQPPYLKGAAEVPAGETVEYGRYLARSMRCGECHGPDLRGGDGIPDLHASTHAYPESLFQRKLRTGIGPTGKMGESGMMPWKVFRRLTDTEIRAMFLYLSRT